MCKPDDFMISRAQGCLLGQLAGDSLGGLVEFRSRDSIRGEYPNGVRDLADGGTWGTLAGQPTDDSEMALVLARMLVERGEYDPEKAREAYLWWWRSEPFDCGGTISSALCGQPNPDSQANGAMMRVSPLGIFGAGRELGQVAEWAEQDAALTHVHEICRQANALFAMAIAHAIKTCVDARSLYGQIVLWAEERNVAAPLAETIAKAADAPPDDYTRLSGWVLLAFQNALWQLLHAPNLEEAVVDTISRGGDTDTNAAICGALLGAVYGKDAVPARWVERILACRPEEGLPHVRHPRPEPLWPIDALELAERLLSRESACPP